MQNCFCFILQTFPMDDITTNVNNNVHIYTTEYIIPGTKEMPINLGPPGKRSYRGILRIYKTKDITTISTSRTLVALNIHASVPVKTVVSCVYPYWHLIENIRVIKGEKLNRYSVLLRFKSNDDASLCHRIYDGYRISDGVDTVLNMSFVHSLHITKSEHFSPPKKSIELPSCPVCLEKLDETVNGLMTIQCDHTFHRDCIYRWNDLNCPVCRLDQSPLNTGDQTCEICESRDCLWICLICGFIGCDRYQNKHAVMHFEETCHAFSKQIGGNKVWDYISDCYVHRIISNEGDNKLIEWEATPKSPDTYNTARNIDIKLDHMEKEYLSLIANQLENQKEFFTEKQCQQQRIHEEEIANLKKQHKEEISTIKTNNKNIIFRNSQSYDLKLKKYEEAEKNYVYNIQMKDKKIAELEEKLNDKSIKVLQNKIKTQEKVINNLKTKLKDTLKQLDDEKFINLSIDDNRELYNNELASVTAKADEEKNILNKKISDLESQVRDLSFHLDTLCIIKDSSEQSRTEVANGTIQINQCRRSYNLKRCPIPKKK